MAKELRSEVNPYEVSQAAAHQTLNSALPQILSTIKDLAASNAPNPMGAMITRLLEPYLSSMMGRFMGAFGIGMMPGVPGQPMQSTPGQPPQGQQPPGQPGFQTPQPRPGQATDDEVKEAFGDV